MSFAGAVAGTVVGFAAGAFVAAIISINHANITFKEFCHSDFARAAAEKKLDTAGHKFSAKNTDTKNCTGTITKQDGTKTEFTWRMPFLDTPKP